MKKISIVITVFNEEDFIGSLLDSIEKINYPAHDFETVVVSDGSTDRTVEIVRRHAAVRLVDLPENTGRYSGRKTGAEAALYPNVLFLDARTIVEPDILTALNQIDAKVINGHCLSVDHPGLFETFYNAIRRLVFFRYFQQEDKPITITPENFDSMPKGAGVLFIEKEELFHAYDALSQTDMNKDSSDDTRLLRAIVARSSILNHPDVKITYFARPSFSSGVKHLFERGPKFVDYYLDPARRNFWLVIVFPLAALLVILMSLIFMPFSIYTKLAALLGLDLLCTLVLSRSMRDFAIILFMLPLCVIVFYAGIVKGIYKKLAARIS